MQQAAETLLKYHAHERVVRVRTQVIRIRDLVPNRFQIIESVRIIVFFICANEKNVSAVRVRNEGVEERTLSICSTRSTAVALACC